MTAFDDDLRLAHVLADAVEPTALELARRTTRTQGAGQDVEVQLEQLLRHHLQRSRPRDVVHGRRGEITGHGRRRWVLDALDGVDNLTRGVPVWATLIGLVIDDQPALGLVSAPALGRRWWGAIGTGAFTGRRLSNASRLQVSTTDDLAGATLSYGGLHPWLDHPARAGFLDLAQRCARTRGFGDFWSHTLVAEGATDLGIAPVADLHSSAALAPLVTEAGGRLSDLEGVDGPFGRHCLTSNGTLHEEAVRLVQRSPHP